MKPKRPDHVKAELLSLDRTGHVIPYYRLHSDVPDGALPWEHWVLFAQAILQADVRYRREVYVWEESRNGKPYVPCPPHCPQETA